MPCPMSPKTKCLDYNNLAWLANGPPYQHWDKLIKQQVKDRASSPPSLNLPSTKATADPGHPMWDLGNIFVPESEPTGAWCPDCSSPLLMVSVGAAEGPRLSPSPWDGAVCGTGWHPDQSQPVMELLTHCGKSREISLLPS